MKRKISLFHNGQLSLATTVLLAVLTSFATNAEAQKVVVYLAVPPPVAAAPAAPDNYVYYPAYAVYYNSQRHLYYYRTGDAWNTQPQPPGVTSAALLASPSVTMVFHDAPARHHGEILKRYPATWQASADHDETAKSGGPEDQKK